MAIIRTGNATHDAALLAAEKTMQASIAAAAGDAAAIKTAEIQFYRTGLASATSDNNGANASHFLTALRQLGVNA
jgi:hypothetical protein